MFFTYNETIFKKRVSYDFKNNFLSESNKSKEFLSECLLHLCLSVFSDAFLFKYMSL
jgi:hypothetical protein